VRIRNLLLLLATVVLVPGFLAAAVAVEKVREGERRAALSSLRETVRAAALLVDGQVQRSVGALTALGASVNLQNGKLGAFYEEARAIDQPPDVWTLLLDEAGTQRINTAVPFGTIPPPPVARQRVAQTLASQRPLVTDLFVGPATGKLLTTLYLPARPSPFGRFVVAQSFSVDHWKNTAFEPSGHAQWVVGVIDRNGSFISRSLRADEMLGKPARPELVAAAAAAHDGLIRHRTLEGVEAYDAFTHSTLTGWTIAVAAPVDTIDATATQAVLWLTAGIVMALIAAVLGASALSRTLIRSIAAAGAAARALGLGVQPVVASTGVHELNALNDELEGAAHLMAGERAARERVEVERSSLLERERAYREDAQADNAAKDRFLALLAHELRNPLAAISGATEVLLRTDPDETTRHRFHGIIQRQNRHLKRIVDDLLEVSRMLSGKIVLDSTAVNLADCVRSGIEALRTAWPEDGSRIVLEVEDAWIAGDQVRIEQVLNNLVANALKFSEKGGRIRVSVASRGAMAVLVVADDGAGIPPELFPRIFEPFVQGPPAPGQTASGLGIGLALVRQLVELHHGTVQGFSDGKGSGATFVVSLPRIASPAATAPNGLKPVVREAPRSRVLLVEDNEDNRETTAALLRMLGYDVTTADNGNAALRTAREQPPDIVVTDLSMPVMTGYELAIEIRRSRTLREIPVIALSGHGDDKDKLATAEAGFDAHLVKPIDPGMLEREISTRLAQARGRR
jgi:signal transduction histidine kinase/CheY-like chemotaxis protein